MDTINLSYSTYAAEISTIGSSDTKGWYRFKVYLLGSAEQETSGDFYIKVYDTINKEYSYAYLTKASCYNEEDYVVLQGQRLLHLTKHEYRESVLKLLLSDTTFWDSDL